MKKDLKYKVRRLIFLYIPITILYIGIMVLALIKSGIYVL